MKIFCKHEWKMVNHFVTESKAEQEERLTDFVGCYTSMTKVYVTDYVCENCGKIKRFREGNG